MDPCYKCRRPFQRKPWQVRRYDYQCPDCRRVEHAERRKKPTVRAVRAARSRRLRAAGRLREADRKAAKLARQRHPEKARARRLVRSALESGALVRPAACERCQQAPKPRKDGRSGLHAHHGEGYAAPLAVTWLCQPCHTAEHRAP